MGRKYKIKLEQEWEGKPISDMNIQKLHHQADKNISDICCGKLKRRKRRLI